MSTIHVGGPVKPKSADKPRSQTVGLIIAVVLLLVAGGIVLSRSMGAKSEERQRMQAADPSVQIQQIRENPNMPPQAKAMAEAQIRAHMGEAATRNASQPVRR